MVPEVDNKTKSVVFATKLVGKVKVSAFETELKFIKIIKMDKKIFRNGPYSDLFSQGVQTGNILTLAGQLGDDLEGNVPKDLQSQMENCYKNIEIVLKEFNATFDNIIDETWFVTDIEECMTSVGKIFD